MSTRTWHTGPPPFPCWWNASTCRAKKIWRWWDGGNWSMGAKEDEPATIAAFMAAHIATHWDQIDIEWTDYWPENARVPRVDPRSKT